MAFQQSGIVSLCLVASALRHVAAGMRLCWPPSLAAPLLRLFHWCGFVGHVLLARQWSASVLHWGEGLPLSRIFLSLVMDPLPYSTHDNRWIDDGLMEFPLLFAVSTFVNGCGSLLSDLPWIIVILLLSTASYYTLSTSSPSRQWQ